MLLNQQPSSAQQGTPSQAAVLWLIVKLQLQMEVPAAASPLDCHSLQEEGGCMCPGQAVLNLPYHLHSAPLCCSMLHCS